MDDKELEKINEELEELMPAILGIFNALRERDKLLEQLPIEGAKH
jgi:hypothetical protein